MMESTAIAELLRGFHDIFIGTEEHRDALQLAQLYRAVILSCKEKAPPREPTQILLSNLENLWSLATLCILQAPQLEPVEFVHHLTRWYQHHSGEEARWMELPSERSSNVPNGFWQSVTRLVAIRNFELACLLLRQVLLEGRECDRDVVELLLERMLQAPTPAAVMDDAGIFDHWILENVQCFSEEDVDFPPKVQDVAAILQGRVSEVRAPLGWMERLIADLTFGQIPFDYEEICAHAASLHVPAQAMDQLSWKLLCFDVHGFSDALLGHCETTEWLPLFYTHFASVVQIPELLAGMTLCASKYAEWVMMTRGREFLELAMDYAALARDETLINRIINELDQRSLHLVGQRHPLVRKLCMTSLRQRAWTAFERQEYQRALSLAASCSDDLLQGMVVKVLLERYSDSQDIRELSLEASEAATYGAALESLRTLHTALCHSCTLEASVVGQVFALLRTGYRLPDRIAEMLSDCLFKHFDRLDIDRGRSLMILEFLNRHALPSASSVLLRERIVHGIK